MVLCCLADNWLPDTQKRKAGEGGRQPGRLTAGCDLLPPCTHPAGAAQQLGEDQQAVCRELHRKLVQAEAKVRLGLAGFGYSWQMDLRAGVL